MKARQLSARGGDLICTHDGARVILQGPCALYLTGEIEVQYLEARSRPAPLGAQRLEG
jgi:hypothetical protein